MSLDDFTDLMGDTITIEDVVGHDGYNEAVYGPATEMRAHVSNKTQLVNGVGGEQIESRRYIIPDRLIETLAPDARVTLTTGLSPRVLDVKGFDVISDEDGPHHSVIYC